MTTIRSTTPRAAVVSTAPTTASSASPATAAVGTSGSSSFTAAATSGSASNSISAVMKKAQDACDDVGGDDAAKLKTLLGKQIPTDKDLAEIQKLYGSIKGDLSEEQQADFTKAICMQMSSKRFVEQMNDSLKKMQDELQKKKPEW